MLMPVRRREQATFVAGWLGTSEASPQWPTPKGRVSGGSRWSSPATPACFSGVIALLLLHQNANSRAKLRRGSAAETALTFCRPTPCARQRLSWSIEFCSPNPIRPSNTRGVTCRSWRPGMIAPSSERRQAQRLSLYAIRWPNFHEKLAVWMARRSVNSHAEARRRRGTTG